MPRRGSKRKLNPKQRLFVEEYLTCWNASEAARRAKYSHPGQQGHRLLKNVEISAEIERRLTDKAMSANEILARLTDMARGDVRSFVRTAKSGEPVGFDLSEGRPLHLVKKVSVTEHGTTVELHDPQAALVKLGEYRRLFVQRHEMGGPGGGPIQTANVVENVSGLSDDELDDRIERLYQVAARGAVPAAGGEGQPAAGVPAGPDSGGPHPDAG